MIRATRPSIPPVLAGNAGKWTGKLLSAKSLKEKKDAEKKYRHYEIREALAEMFHGKCAYCESKIAHVSYAHVEHFRPKSRFQDQTFEWTNLLLACGVCNGAEHKGELFPEPTDGGPLINPCDENPDAHFFFEYGPVTKLAKVYGKTCRGALTERILGLNRFDLLQYRSKHVRMLACVAIMAHSNDEARHLLMEAMEDSGEYAAFARELGKRRGGT